VTSGDDERFDALERERGYVRAWLRLTPTEAGGKRRPIRSGYRPQWDLGYRTAEGEIAYCDAEVRLVGGPRPVKWCTRILSASSSLERYAAWAMAITSSGSAVGAVRALVIDSALM
jgi:hypothetical protein